MFQSQRECVLQPHTLQYLSKLCWGISPVYHSSHRVSLFYQTHNLTIKHQMLLPTKYSMQCTVYQESIMDSCWYLVTQALTHTVSSLRNPVRLPSPYLIEKFLPLGTYVLDLELSYFLWMATKKIGIRRS